MSPFFVSGRHRKCILIKLLAIQIQYIMKVQKLLCLLLLATLAITAPLTQQQADSFLRGGKFVPLTAVLTEYKQDKGRLIMSYLDKFTTYKFILEPQSNGMPKIIFRNQVTQISISNNNMTPKIGQMNFIPSPPMFQFSPIPMIPMPPMPGFNFDQEMLAGGEFRQGRHGRGMGRHGGRGFFGGRRGGCKINQEEVKTLLKDNLVIFKNAEIKQISRIGFEKASGVILSISLVNEGKPYTVTAGFRPRWGKLNIIKIEQQQNQQTPLQTGQKLIAKAVENLPKQENNPINQQFSQIDNLIQSFVQKLLIRKSFNLGQKHSHSFVQKPPILVGSQGQIQSVERPPFLLGSEGQPQSAQEAPFLLGSEGQPQMNQQAPILLGKEGQPQNPTELQVPQPVVEEEPKKDRQQVDSEQISEIVTDVISKLKLKRK